ncbi:MAG TPA: hypothetical protein H9903_05735 [Candidatus Aquabacterium excrementipullorum]|nr:hypothetical protein [Candidatus Aquabacterium excrementipullorum]
MRITHQFSLARQPQQNEDDEPRSALLLDGQPTGHVLPGAVLEAAVQWQGQHLLFITDDVPYEEALRIVLLDADLQTLDAAELGAAYSTGSFTDLALHPPDTVSFRFIGSTEWTVRLLGQSQFRLPLVSEPRGVSRRLGFSRRFVVDGDPQPQGR